MFRILEDGAWHSLKEITEKTAVPIEELVHRCEDAYKHGLVDYDANSGRVRLSQKFTNMIMKLRTDDDAEAYSERIGAGTVIIPAGKNFEIQGITVQNITRQDLKFEFTFTGKLKEIVVSKV